MKKINMKNLIMAAMLFLFVNLPVMAQTGFEDDVDDVPDEPQAPINGYVAAAFVTGCALGYVLLKRTPKLS